MSAHPRIPPADPRIAFFDQHAPHWDDDPAAVAQVLARVAALHPRLDIRPGMTVLEAGCGTGQLTSLLVEWAGPGCVTAVDFAPAMLARARARGLAADFRELDICTQAPEREAYDLALCFQSFPHFRDRQAALRHLAESLKPGGRLVILHLAGSVQVNAFHREVGSVVGADQLPAASAWPELLTKAGLHLHALEDRPDLLWVEAVRNTAPASEPP
jgi:SAM-dependent methyltransferase